jgi:hypothetical protein
MAWEQRRNRRYYYRKRREGKRVVSEYVGASDFAKLGEAIDAEARAERESQRQAQRQERQQAEAGERELKRLADLADDLTRAVLIASGYHTHRRQWRKAR